MARRFGSAMISNTDSTLLIYPTEHILVKAYNKKKSRLRQGCHSVCRDALFCNYHRGLL